MNRKRRRIWKRAKRKEFMEALRPIRGEGHVIGYVEEIHKDGAIKVTITLPLGAIKRLISSYYETLEAIAQMSVYYGQTGSWEIRQKPYCDLMLDELICILNLHGQDGVTICQEIWDAKFKKKYDEMEVYKKAHENEKGQCDDPKCHCHWLAGKGESE